MDGGWMDGITKLTLIVNLLYGNNTGIRLKKWSSYSSSATALRATCASKGLIPGGNLPLWSQFSVQKKKTQTPIVSPSLDPFDEIMTQQRYLLLWRALTRLYFVVAPGGNHAIKKRPVSSNPKGGGRGARNYIDNASLFPILHDRCIAFPFLTRFRIFVVGSKRDRGVFRTLPLEPG